MGSKLTAPAIKVCGNPGCNNPSPKRPLCDSCRAKLYAANNPGYKAEYMAMKSAEAKAKFIEVYGGECECCGESHPVFLTIDHTNDDGGGRDRPSRGLYRWLDAIDCYGDGTRALMCFNCNTGRHINGGICPHKEAT